MAFFTYSYENIISIVRSLLQEDSVDFFTDSMLRNYINEAMYAVNNISGAKRTVTPVYTVASQRLINIASLGNIIKIIGIECLGKSLVKINPTQLGHVALDGTEPQYWFEHGDYIGIEPIPDDTYTIVLYLIGEVIVTQFPDVTFTISPPSLLQYNDQGGHYHKYPVTLSWTTNNAVSASIDQGVGAVPLNGSTIVYPELQTTWTLTAVSTTGGVTTAQVSIYAVLLVYPYEDEDIALSGMIESGSYRVPTPSISALPTWRLPIMLPVPVTITDEVATVELYYTKDNSTPTDGSLLYTVPFDLDNADWISGDWDYMIVKAIAKEPVSGDFSDVASSSIMYKLMSGIFEVTITYTFVVVVENTIMDVTGIINNGSFLPVVILLEDIDYDMAIVNGVIGSGWYQDTIVLGEDIVMDTAEVSGIISSGWFEDTTIQPP